MTNPDQLARELYLHRNMTMVPNPDDKWATTDEYRCNHCGTTLNVNDGLPRFGVADRLCYRHLADIAIATIQGTR